jgi:Zn-dependent peptidase ImmA (M78 family)
MLTEIPVEQVRSTVEGVARDILAEAGVFAPPVDAVDMARRLGLVVANDDAALGVRARFVRLGGQFSAPQPTILVAEEPRPERRQWAVAHEIGEHQAHRVFAELGVDPGEAAPGAREAVANRLAGCLLLPRDWLLADGIDLDWDLCELKARYATASHELIARRMLEMPPPVIVTLFDHGRPVWRRANQPGRTPSLTPPERAAQAAAHDCGRPARCDAAELPDGIEDVRAWPIHEPDWKREIIRTQVSELW